MLQAIKQHKIGRNFNANEIKWHNLFKASEDSLTSSVFERMFYLPVELFWQILSEACYGNHLPLNTGRILSKEFWPHWDAEDTKNENFVEPDVFIRFEHFDLIIEAKRFDVNQQYKAQWQNQIKAYKNEYGEENKSLFYIALGGLKSKECEKVENIHVIKCQWKQLLFVTNNIYEQLSSAQKITNTIDATLNILNDLIIAFQIHGYYTGKWLNTMPVSPIVNFSKSIETLSKFMIKYK